jgi:hypothetical protein
MIITNNLTLSNFRDQHRAWVLVDKIDTTNGFKILTPLALKVGDAVGADVTFKNSGNTLAKDLSITVTIVPKRYDSPWDGKHGEQLTFPFEEIQGGATRTLASGNTGFNTVFLDGHIDKYALEALLDDRLVVYVHGRITYRDIFDVEHWSRFCALLLSGGGWAQCTSGNEVDENQELPPPLSWW